MTVLTPANAFPGIPVPQHGSGQSIVTNYLYPGAVQVKSTGPGVLSYTNAFPGIPFPNHLSGQSTPQSYLYPGALQPIVSGATGTFATPFASMSNIVLQTEVVSF